MKVYCKDCEHYDYFVGYRFGGTCWLSKSDKFSEVHIDVTGYKYRKVKEDEIYKELLEFKDKTEIDKDRIQYAFMDKIMNTNFNCKYYKRKWWKFWV